MQNHTIVCDASQRFGAIQNATVTIALLTVLALPGTAGTLFSQGPPNGNSYDITDFRLADDFSLSSASTVNDISFWYQAQESTDLAAVTYAIYSDDSGALGASIQSETINNIATSFDQNSGLFFADFAVTPVSLLGATPYWLELHAGSSLTDTSGFTVSWGAAGDNATAIALANQSLGTPNAPVNVSGFDQYAFELSGSASSATPEPGTELLVGLAACLLALPLGRRRKTRACPQLSKGDK